MKILLVSVTWLSVTAVVACSRKTNNAGSVLDRAKMQAVMWDLMRADELLAHYVFSRDTSLNKIAESQKLYQRIFEIHRITKETFQRSYAYYSSRPEMMKILMDSIAAMKPVFAEKVDITVPQSQPDTTPVFTPSAGYDTSAKKKSIGKLQIN